MLLLTVRVIGSDKNHVRSSFRSLLSVNRLESSRRKRENEQVMPCNTWTGSVRRERQWHERSYYNRALMINETRINPPMNRHIRPLIAKPAMANRLGLSTKAAIALITSEPGAPTRMVSPARALRGLLHPGWSTHTSPNVPQGTSERPSASFPMNVRLTSAKGDSPREATPGGSGTSTRDGTGCGALSGMIVLGRNVCQSVIMPSADKSDL